MAHREQVQAFYDERFCRLWEFYLAASEVAFRVGSLNNFQIQLVRHQQVVPLTRDYIYKAEAELRARDSGVGERRPERLAAE